MADGTFVMRQGDLLPIPVTLPATAGALQILGTPKATLCDHLGQAVAGFSNVDATNWDRNQQVAPRVWFALDASLIPGLPSGSPGRYWLEFRIASSALDGSPDRRDAPAVQVLIDPPFIVEWTVQKTEWPSPDDVIALFETSGLAVPATARPEDAIASAIQEIQRETNRTFVQVTEARRFDGRGGTTLRIDDCTEVTAIAMLSSDGTSVSSLAATGWQALSFGPRASMARDVKHAVRRINGPWPYGMGNVRVTATFGEPLTDDLWLACAERAALSMFPMLWFLRTQGVMSWSTGGPEGQDKQQLFPRPYIIDGWMEHSNRVININRRLF